MLRFFRLISLIFLLTGTSLVSSYLFANGKHVHTHNHTEHEDIKKVLVLKNWKPYYYVDEMGVEKGFAIDIFKRIALKAGIHYEFVVANSWPEANQLIKDGKIDIVPNMGISEERKKFIVFSNPVNTFKISFFKHASSHDIAKHKDLSGKKVAVVKNNIAIELLKKNKEFKNIIPIIYESYFDALNSLINKNVDALCYPQPLLIKTIQDLELENTIVEIKKPIKVITRAIGITHENKEMIGKINNALTKIKANGTHEEIYQKWFHKKENVFGNESFVFTVITLIILILLFLVLYLKRIEKKDTKRVFSLFVIFFSVVFFTIIISLYFMYLTAYEEQKQRLQETAKTKARLIESINAYDTKHFISNYGTEKDAFEATMSQVIDAHSQSTGIGKTGEFTLAKLEKNQIVFILNHRHADLEHPKPVPLNSTLAEPMRLALSGVSGVIEGQDYRGETVLAAIEPVYTTTRLGLVAKIDLKEVREPFIKASLYSTLIAGILVFIGSYGFLRITNPLIRKIEESEKQYKGIIETANEAIVIVDSKQNITFANSKAIELFKFKNNKNFIGENYSQFVPAEYIATHTIRLEDREKGLSENYETKLLTKDGSEIWAIISATPIFDSENRYTGVLKMITDISERKESEDALINARIDAEKANETKSLFLSNMSHEIRTPLNGILGLTKLTLATELNSKQEYYLNRVYSSSKSLLNIINDILDYSKIEANQFQLENEPFNLNNLLDNTSGLFGLEIEKKGIELLFDIDNNVPINLIGDQLRLSQILLNLIGNAIKFTEQGEILLSISSKKINESIHEVKFSVKDTGIGIKREDQEKIFAKFSQVDDSYKRQYEGTGLGLAITKEFVRLMGGEIYVNSVYGEGSTFTFTAKLEIDTNKQEIIEMIDIKKGGKALIVDDLDTSREILKDIFDNWDITTDLSSCGQEALEFIKKAIEKKQPYDYILLDWKMPELSGIDTAKEIEQLYKDANQQMKSMVIMVSAYSKDEISHEIEKNEVNIDTIVVKPVTQSSLFDTIITHEKPLEDISRKLRKTNSEHLKKIWGSHVLLVEDNDVNQTVAKAYLENMHLKVTIANHGKDAIKHVQENDFDIILMDLQMPIMDGIEATKEIKKIKGKENIPIVAMTAAAMKKDKEKSAQIGMVAHINKPINLNILENTLLKFITPSKHPEVSQEKQNVNKPSSNINWNSFKNVNITKLLENLQNDEELTVSLLKTFADKYSNIKEQLHFEETEMEEFYKFIHSLKGESGNLCITKVHKIAKKIDEDKKSATLSENTLLLQNAIEDVITEVNNILLNSQSDDSEQNNTQNTKEIKALLNKFNKELDKNYIISFEDTKELLNQLKSHTSQSNIIVLKELLENLDYNKVKEILEQIMDDLK